jgi:Domain of unknown function (DUF4347)
MAFTMFVQLSRVFRYSIALALPLALMSGVGAGGASASSPPAPLEADGAATSIVFIDPAVRAADVLRAGLSPRSEVVLLAPDVPLLEQMAKALAGRHNVGAVHILSHGSAGAVLTGTERLDRAGLHSARPEVLATIRAALTDDADILLYGCNIAEGAGGAAFADDLASATGADVAASANATGHLSKGGDWDLEYQRGAVETQVAVLAGAQAAWHDTLTITITVAGNTAALLNALTSAGMNGVTLTGTPTVLGAFGSNAYGTFTSSGSNIGMSTGAIFGTGNVTQVSGAPSFFWDGAGTGNSSGSERDRAALTFSFTPNTGITKVAFRYVMGSEEYNEYVGQNFSDNITIRLTGGIYTGTNVALVPGTSTGIDIDTINNSLNSAYYRDNTIASPPVPDSVLDGHTTLLRTISTVVPGTSYAAEIKVADYTDALYNSAIFVDYFGSSLSLDLDGNNSSGATLADYQNTFTEGGAAVAVADTDDVLTNYDTTSIQNVVITLTNAKTSDVMTVGTLPSGITGSVNTGTPGVITVTLSGASTTANYQTAIRAVTFSNSSNSPDTTARNITVVANDGSTNSNTGTTTITVVSVPNYAYTVGKTTTVGTIAAPGTIPYTIVVTNTGDTALTGIANTDTLTQAAYSTTLTLSGPTGDGGVIGTLDVGEVWTYTGSYSATQARIDNGSNIVNTVSFTTSQTGATATVATATTTVTRTPGLLMVKNADNAGSVTAGQSYGYTYDVTNTGNVTVTNISIGDVHGGHGTDPVPGDEVLLTDAGTAGDSTDAGSNGIWTSLAPGDTIRFSSTYQVVQSDIDRLQ